MLNTLYCLDYVDALLHAGAAAPAPTSSASSASGLRCYRPY